MYYKFVHICRCFEENNHLKIQLISSLFGQICQFYNDVCSKTSSIKTLLISVSLAQLGFVMSVLINLTTSLSEWRRLTRSTITFSTIFAFEYFFFEDFYFDNFYLEDFYFEDIHFGNVQFDNICRISPIYFSPSPIYGISKTQIQKKKHMDNLKKINYVKFEPQYNTRLKNCILLFWQFIRPTTFNIFIMQTH